MSAHMSLHHDPATLRLMAAELPDYLLSDVLFWQMQASSDYPKLSLGLMWLIRAELEARAPQLPSAQFAAVDKANREIDVVLAKWPVAAEKKALQELRSRINLWKAFWDDYVEDPYAHAHHYSDEVTQRVIAALLLHHFPRLADSTEAKRLAPLDAQLRALLKSGAFIWPAELEAAFPKDDFWFLYGQVG
jgi:hypothetical protein